MQWRGSSRKDRRSYHGPSSSARQVHQQGVNCRNGSAAALVLGKARDCVAESIPSPQHIPATSFPLSAVSPSFSLHRQVVRLRPPPLVRPMAVLGEYVWLVVVGAFVSFGFGFGTGRFNSRSSSLHACALHRR